MKKLVIILILLLTGCTNSTFKVTEDSKKFKAEYEALNGEVTEAGSEYLKLKINKANPFKYLTYEETMEFLDSGTGIIIFSRPGCPYCRATLNATIEFAEKNNIKRINYYNPEAIREANNAEYKALLEKLDKYLLVDTVTQKETDTDFNKDLKRLVVPHIFFINNGDVIYNYQESRSEFRTKLTDLQEKEIIDLYTEGYEKLSALSGVCNKEC